MIRWGFQGRKRLLASLPSRQDRPTPWPSANPLMLYPFRFRDPLSGKWVRARYVVECHEIIARYAEWEIIGPREMRRPLGAAFTPWKQTGLRLATNGQLRPYSKVTESGRSIAQTDSPISPLVQPCQPVIRFIRATFVGDSIYSPAYHATPIRIRPDVPWLSPTPPPCRCRLAR